MPSGQRWVNVHHVRKVAVGAWAPADVTAVQAIMVRLYKGAAMGGGQDYMANCNNTLTLDDVTYTPLDGTSPSTVVTVALAGASAAVSCPSEVAFVLTLRTGYRGRANRGRVYLPAPITTAIVAPGVLLATSVTSTVAQAVGMQALLVAAGYEHVVASYKYANQHFITGYSMDNKADVQRGRK
jgi:hypothetical protein